MSAATRRYIRENDEENYQNGFNQQEMEVAHLRMQFLNKYIVNFDTFAYKTVVEKDWAYICKREYNYDVRLQSAFKSLFVTNLLLSTGIYLNKRMVYSPLLVLPVFYYYFSNQNMTKCSKKLFDMCNVGEQYYLGQKRNEILRQCNQILQVQDF